MIDIKTVTVEEERASESCDFWQERAHRGCFEGETEVVEMNLEEK